MRYDWNRLAVERNVAGLVADAVLKAVPPDRADAGRQSGPSSSDPASFAAHVRRAGNWWADEDS